MADLAELRRKLEAASQGRWYVGHLPPNTGGCREIKTKPENAARQYQGTAVAHTTGLVNDDRDAANAALIVSAINALPALLAVAEAAEKYVDSEDDAHYRDRLRTSLASLTRNDGEKT